MRNFNSGDWREEKGTTFEVASGVLFVMSNKPVSVFVETDGVESFLGTGTQIRYKTQAKMNVRLERPPASIVHVYDPIKQVTRPTGPVFTNADRMPLESGTLFEIRRAARMFQLERKRQVEEMRRLSIEREPLPEPPAAETAVDPEPVLEEVTPTSEAPAQ